MPLVLAWPICLNAFSCCGLTAMWHYARNATPLVGIMHQCCRHDLSCSFICLSSTVEWMPAVSLNTVPEFSSLC